MARRHPDWVCRGPDGRRPQVQRVRGTFLDLTSPYREVVLSELITLAGKGADGFFFDATHFPPSGCWGSHLQRAFELETGHAAPTAIDPSDPRYLEFLGYQAQQLQSVFAYWRERVHERYPGVVFVVSVATLPTLMDPRYPTGLAAAGDVPKTELGVPVRPALGGWTPGDDGVPRDVRIAAGWSLARDAAMGRPPVIWSPSFADSVRTLGFVAATLTYGGIPSLNVADGIAAGQESAPDAAPVTALRSASALGDRIAPAVAGRRPVAWVGVHFPEGARNGRMADPDEAYRTTVLPALRAYEVLLRSRIPVRWVTDEALARGEVGDLKLLVLPDSSDLTGEQAHAVVRFRTAGGQVIGGGGTSLSRALAELGKVVTGGPPTLHVGYFRASRGDRTTILVTPDFSWVRPDNRRGRRAGRTEPPPLITGVVLHLPGEPPPEGIRELATGQDLEVARTERGYEVRLPPFRFLAVVVIGPL
jgi:hypothetical protein